MNTLKTSAVLIATCLVTTGSALVAIAPALADYQSFRMAPGFTPDPQVGTGVSGGTRSTADCGYVDQADAPDHIVQLTQDFSFLRAAVEAQGDVTLLIEGPDGRFCSDDVNGLMPEISGFWPAGTYNVWIGDFVGNSAGSYPYSLYLSEY